MYYNDGTWFVALERRGRDARALEETNRSKCYDNSNTCVSYKKIFARTEEPLQVSNDIM